MAIQELPKLRPDGTYDPIEVVLHSRMSGEAVTAKALNIPMHRIIFFATKLKQNSSSVKGKNLHE